MPRFFTTGISGGKAEITGDDARHIVKALRMRAGEELELCDMNGSDYRCVITGISGESVLADVIEKRPCLREPRVKISLYQALPKSDKFDLIIQKAVELGASEITPVLTERCVSVWDNKDSIKKRDRLQRIALEAAKQSGRGIIPVINPICRFEQAIESMKSSDLAILFYENSRTPLKEILDTSCKSIAIMIGCEGGFTDGEAGRAENAGLATASLGSRILRCETASLCAISAINFACGEF